jgi:uncharacterized protein YjbI with pentapeptide repeats
MKKGKETLHKLAKSSNRHAAKLNTDFNEIEVKNDTVKGLYLGKADFNKSDFSGTMFTECFFNNSDFRNCNLKNTRFDNCTLTGTKFENALNFNPDNLTNCNGLEDKVKNKFGFVITKTEFAAIQAKEAQEKQSNYPFMRNGTKARFGRFIDAMRNLTREQTQAHEALKEKEAINGSK